MKTLRHIVLSVLVYTVLLFVVLYHYNSLLSSDNNPVLSVSVSGLQTPTAADVPSVTGIGQDLFAISDDGSMLAYVDKQNTLHLIAMNSAGQVSSSQGISQSYAHKITFIKWIRNDEVIVASEGSGNIYISTLNALGGQMNVIKDFTDIIPGVTVKNITFSPYTNDVYILMGNQNSYGIYHYDVNDVLTQVSLSNAYVSNIESTITTGDLYFQDVENGVPNVWIDQNFNPILIAKDAVLINVQNNTLYYGLVNAQGNVEEVERYQAGSSSLFERLSNPLPAHDLLVNQEGDLVEITNAHTYVISGKTETVSSSFRVERVQNQIDAVSENQVVMIND